MTNKPTLLVIEDDEGLRRQLRWGLDEYEIHEATDRESAIEALSRQPCPVITLDLGLPPDPEGVSEGFAALKAILSMQPDAKVIVVTGRDDHEHAVRAIALGAYDFYHKPIDIDVLRLIISRAYHLHALEQENRALHSTTRHSPLEGIIAASPQMLEVCRMIEKVAPTDATVLLLGDSGTGKEVLARALHAMSSRSKGKFVAINCAAIPDALLESELFGYEKGAFTGAAKQKRGKIEDAEGGTLFLDEIGDLSPALQAKLLRFMQERVIERLGGNTEIPVDVRVVCATHQPLEERITEGQFREDLYYRISELTVRIPPLRERIGDAVLLARVFLERFRVEVGGKARGFTDGALSAIEAHEWPGNVRELENRVKRALILCDDRLIDEAALQLPGSTSPCESLRLQEVREQAESQALRRALSRSNGNVSKAAELLGVSRPTCYALMSKYGMK